MPSSVLVEAFLFSTRYSSHPVLAEPHLCVTDVVEGYVGCDGLKKSPHLSIKAWNSTEKVYFVHELVHLDLLVYNQLLASDMARGNTIIFSIKRSQCARPTESESLVS